MAGACVLALWRTRRERVFQPGARGIGDSIARRKSMRTFVRRVAPLFVFAAPFAFAALASGCSQTDEAYKAVPAFSGRRASLPAVPWVPGDHAHKSPELVWPSRLASARHLAVRHLAVHHPLDSSQDRRSGGTRECRAPRAVRRVVAAHVLAHRRHLAARRGALARHALAWPTDGPFAG